MPNFKPKSAKKIVINKNSNITLDNKHKELMDKYTNEELNEIPNLKQKFKILKKRLKKAKTIEEKMDIEDKMTDIKKK